MPLASLCNVLALVSLVSAQPLDEVMMASSSYCTMELEAGHVMKGGDIHTTDASMHKAARQQ